MPDWLRTVDWALLRAQKQWLLAQPESAEAQGLVGLLDAIQDAAVETWGVSEQEVFALG